MPFKPGKPRHPKAGRRKGTPNKKTISILTDLEEVLTEDGQPVNLVKMFFAGLMTMPPYQQVDALLKFMEFVYPKRKQMEHSLGDDEFKQALVQRIMMLNDSTNRTRTIESE